MGKALETANRFYEITENKKGKGLEDVLAKDVTFDGPLMKFNGAKEYIESTRQFLQMHMATRMQKQFENGNDVCSIYEMDVATPSGGMITLEVVDWVQVTNGKVARQKIFYDPREFAKAFGMGWLVYNEQLADKIRAVVAGCKGLSEKMFGGVAVMLNGNMFCGVVKDDLLVRVGAERNDEALVLPHSRPMDLAGKPMKGFIYVDSQAWSKDAVLKKSGWTWASVVLLFQKSNRCSLTGAVVS